MANLRAVVLDTVNGLMQRQISTDTLVVGAGIAPLSGSLAVSASAGAVSISAAGASNDVTVNSGGSNVILQTGGATKLTVTSASVTVAAGVTLATTGTGNINLPNNVSARFQIEAVAVGATVTATNLGTLTTGTTTDAAALHTHNTMPNAVSFTAAGTAIAVTNNVTVGGTLAVAGTTFANGGLDRSTAATLLIGTTTATAITLGGAATPVTTGQNLLVTGIIDRNAAGTLSVGTTTATAITLGGAAVPVTTGQNLLVTGIIDRNAAGTLSLGTTTATAVVIGSTVTATSVTANAASSVNLQIAGTNVVQVASGSVSISQVLFTNANIDRSSAATLSIGGANATAITIGRATQNVVIANTMSIVGATTATGAVFVDGGLDRSTAAALAIGSTNATTITIGRATQNVAIANTMTIAGATTATGAVFADGGLDRSGAAALAIGGTNATSVTIGSTATTTTVTANAATNVNLQIGGSTKLQVASAALTIQAGVILGTTGTGNINLPNNGSAKFQIEAVAVGTTVTSVNLNTLTNGSNADALHSHAGLGATPTQVRASGLTTTSITSGNCTYVSANSTVSHTDNAAIASARFLGVYSGTTGEVISDGVVNANFTTAGGSPTPGASVFLAASSDDTATGAGKLTATVPSAGVLSEIGICISNANYVGSKTCVILLQVKSPIQL